MAPGHRRGSGAVGTPRTLAVAVCSIDLLDVSISGDSLFFALVATSDFVEESPSLSPDGRWLVGRGLSLAPVLGPMDIRIFARVGEIPLFNHDVEDEGDPERGDSVIPGA